jgi:nucleoside-diphosphate-sugar epimerase
MAERELVLVTGANGFVGSHLTEALLARGYRVRCMVRESSDCTFIAHLPVEWIYADLRDHAALRQACRGVVVICHCASMTRARDQETFFQVNTKGTEALAEAALEEAPGLRRFLYISSVGAVGPSQGPDDYVDESRTGQPLGWYDKSKWAAEQALLSMKERLPLTIIRPAAVFGPRDRDLFAYFELVKHHLGLALAGDRRLSLVYVHDLVALILLALEKQAALGQTYFACNAAHSYKEFSNVVARALDKRIVYIGLPLWVLRVIALGANAQERVTGQPALLNEQRLLNMRQPYWLCSSEKARRELGFAPQYTLETAVRETANWYIEHGWL